MAIQSWRWLIQCELGAPPLLMWQWVATSSSPPPFPDLLYLLFTSSPLPSLLTASKSCSMLHSLLIPASSLFSESTKGVQCVDGTRTKNGSELENQRPCLQGLPLIPLPSIALHTPSTVFQFSYYGSDYHGYYDYYGFGSVSYFSIFSESFQTGLFKHGRQVTSLPETPPPVQSPRKETQESVKNVNLLTSIFNSKGWQDRLCNGTLSEFHKLKGVKNWRLVTCHRTRWFSNSLHL